jgi:hypothetical protein
MKNLSQILKPLALKCKWAFLFTWNKIYGTVQTVCHALYRKAFMWNIYTTCYDMPRENYIRCVCEEDLRHTKRTLFYVPNSLLVENYSKINEEYARLSDNKEIEFVKIKQNEIKTLQEKILIYRLCYHALIGNHNLNRDTNTFADYLSSVGIFGTDTRDLVKKLEGRLKNIGFQIKELVSQLKDEKKDVGIATREDYESIAIILEKNGYHLGTSTANFIIALNLQRKEQKEMEKMLNKK